MFSYIITTLLGLIAMNIIYKIIDLRFTETKIKIMLYTLVFLLAIIIFNMIEVEIKYNHEEHYKNLTFKIIMGLICGLVGLGIILNNDKIYEFIRAIFTILSPKLVENLEKTIYFSMFIILSLLIATVDYFTK
jgi:hypothetical protein